ncbi:hypothetical protein MAM1_0361c10031 [Mucor ambiguus]|uniref:Uncharacterized protein n=1 Tax=Mucor ambiguus TaxID=91626 RepID=A0A0C9LXX3_9FUNG|nr:hypothetical protein MAM1_0361c10031 [Mucor ambiguus]
MESELRLTEESAADVHTLELSKYLLRNEITLMAYSSMTMASSNRLEDKEKLKSRLLMYNPESTSESKKVWTFISLMGILDRVILVLESLSV